MTNTVNTSIRIDKSLKKKADITFRSMGLTFSSAINMFIKQVVNSGELPFKPQANLSTEELLEIEQQYKTD
ncbi:MAG: type II toxin-antitoxin system RelB/DinJ family antitoxin [Clostridiales bacterium]|nr:type II toxin-antitoxin system RelB/DinJ family antitoxin [Clostridiales bacterium]